MWIVTTGRLSDAAKDHPDALPSLSNWKAITQRARWNNIMAVRQDFNSADPVGNFTIFNIAGNKYRLITLIDYRAHKVFIRGFLTHSEYTKGGWKSDPWYE